MLLLSIATRPTLHNKISRCYRQLLQLLESLASFKTLTEKHSSKSWHTDPRKRFNQALAPRSFKHSGEYCHPMKVHKVAGKAPCIFALLAFSLSIICGLALSRSLTYAFLVSSTKLSAFIASSIRAYRVLKQSFLFSSRCSNLCNRKKYYISFKTCCMSCKTHLMHPYQIFNKSLERRGV